MPERSFLVGIEAAIDLAGLKHLQVCAFSAHEEIGEPYRVDIMVETPQGESAVDLKKAVGQPASVTLEKDHREFAFAGVIRRIEHLGCTPLLAHVYRIRIVHPLALLDQGRRCRIFRQMSVTDIIRSVLSDAEITVSMSVNGSYGVRPHVLQYQESDLDFIDRLMEQEGLFSFFQFDERGKGSLSIGDYPGAHPDNGVKISASYDLIADSDVIGPVFAQSIPEKSFTVKDYDAQHPANPFAETVELGSGATAAAVGKRAEYDQQFPLTQKDAKRYAQVRMEQAQCSQLTATASSGVFRVRAGHLISLEDHPIDSFNGKYLVERVDHELGSDAQGYRNRFTLIPQAMLPYRLPIVTEVPEIPGYLLAKVTTVAGNQNDQEVDGAYAVQLLLEEDSATRVVRMAQPYGGSDRGMHFPLAQGTEVLLGHLNGDPDRPFIIGALPNSEAPSVVVEDNKTQSVIKSSANSTLVLEDDKNKQAVTLASGGGHHLVFRDDQEHPTIKLFTNGGSQLLMDDTDQAALINLMTKGGHQVKLDDAQGGPKILVRTTGAHSITLDDTTSAPQIAIQAAQSHSVVLDGTPGAASLTLKTEGGHKLALTDTPSPAIALSSAGGSSLKMDDSAPKITIDTMGDLTISAIMNIKISADLGIKLVCGASSISLDPAGNIKISGVNVTVNGSAEVQVQGAEISVEGEGPVAVKGAIIQLN